MSTLVVTSLRHTSSSSNNVVLDSGGNATFAANTSVAGNLLFNSGFGSAAIAYGCRAWVNFNGTGTVAIRGSGNISSITDNGVGDYTLNFTNAMPDANYFVGGIAGRAGTNALAMLSSYPVAGGGYSTGSMRVYTVASNGFNSGQGVGSNNLDVEFNTVAIFR